MSKKEITLREHVTRIGKLGGRSRMDSMSDEERAEFHSAGGKAGGWARSEALTPEQRSGIAKRAAEARWGKKAAKKATKRAGKKGNAR